MATMKPNWVHSCTGQGACCTLLCVVGKLDIYYAHAIRAYVVRSSDTETQQFQSAYKLRKYAEENPDVFEGLVAAIDMGALETSVPTTS
jgi:hypothetical protein